jgi:GNAT superfamily N-acetyltransferase
LQKSSRCSTFAFTWRCKMRISYVNHEKKCGFVELMLNFIILSHYFYHEKHLLWNGPWSLMRQYLKGLSVLAFDGRKIIGHITLWPLEGNWYESGSMWVHPDYRRHGVGILIKRKLIEKSEHLNVLSTTTNPIVMKMNEGLGISNPDFWDLPENIHRATCICSAEKMRTDCWDKCELKNDQCQLFVRFWK